MSKGTSYPIDGWKIWLALLTTGAGIGWLVGLSVSPVVSVVVSSVTGVVTALIALLSGVKLSGLNGPQINFVEHESEATPPQTRYRHWQVNPVPIAWLMLGLILGSSSGIWVRTHDLLSPHTQSLSEEAEVARWEALGLKKEEVAARLFDRHFPLPGQSLTPLTQSTPASNASVLFSAEAKATCTAVIQLIEQQNYMGMRTTLIQSKAFGTLMLTMKDKIVQNDEELARVVREILCVNTL